jgi:hypothetical protein
MSNSLLAISACLSHGRRLGGRPRHEIETLRSVITVERLVARSPERSTDHGSSKATLSHLLLSILLWEARPLNDVQY